MAMMHIDRHSIAEPAGAAPLSYDQSRTRVDRQVLVDEGAVDKESSGGA